jgi:hypothetical protein
MAANHATWTAQQLSIQDRRDCFGFDRVMGDRPISELAISYQLYAAGTSLNEMRRLYAETRLVFTTFETGKG